MTGLIIDCFAGGGGASTGIEQALGRPVDIAINHSRAAVAMHAVNHPHTRHFCEDVWDVDPREACGGRSVWLAWFSPDCTHFSRAKGGQPRSKAIRGLADVVVRWARAVQPEIIMLENVEEFRTWGPLREDGTPDRDRSGEDFRRWLGELAACGYEIDFRTLAAADYGAPTSRRRLFLVATRRGGIAWPEPTHGTGRDAPWRTAAEVIDWTIPCPSIFERRKPLAEATLRRIAAGLRRYVLEAGRPFLVPVKSWGGGGNGPRSLDEPMRTVTASKRGEFALVAPTMIRTDMQSDGRLRGVASTHDPLRTITTANGHALVAGFLTRHYGGIYREDLDTPMSTVTAREHITASRATMVSAAWLASHYGESIGRAADRPVPAITAGGGGHTAAVRAFLVKYYGADGRAESQAQGISDPLHTVTTRARFGLVSIEGEDYQIIDVGMRMLTPRELYRAQGFPEHYSIDFEFNGRPLSKTRQIELCGNSVRPPVAQALVAAQVGQRATRAA